MRVAATTRIACPADRVFDTLADLRNEPRWNSRVSKAELRTDEPVALGSRFAIVNGGTPYDVTISAFERPSRLVFEASGGPASRSLTRSRQSSAARSSRATSTFDRPEA